MSLIDDVVNAIEDDGPITVEQLWRAIGGTRKQISNAICRALRNGDIRPAGMAPLEGRRGPPSVRHVIGRGPAWNGRLPSPLPVNSVWQLGSRA
jgi:hypothetical protein